MKILYIIPARAGSKGLPGKNVKMLGSKPLLMYSIEFALNNMKEGDELCISTNDQEVINIAENHGVKVDFRRPETLSSDSASTYDVIMHALDYYKINKNCFDAVMLLQPTSPFRNQEDFNAMIHNYSDKIDMVVSVKEAKENPYFTLFEEGQNGYLNKSKTSNFLRRQDCPSVFAFNGSMYLINTESLKAMQINEFTKIKKVVMPEERSIDIDTIADWVLAEFYIK